MLCRTEAMPGAGLRKGNVEIYYELEKPHAVFQFEKS